MKVVELAGTGDQWSFHRLPQALDELGLKPRHVLHVGANLGQEVPDYRAAGIEEITLVEPDPDTAEQLRETYPDLTVLEVACGTKTGGAMLRRVDAEVDAHHVWSTLAETPMPHGQQVATEAEVAVVTVAFLQDGADMLVIDTQGTELDALKSADLSRLSLVVIETQEAGPEHHAAYWPDVLSYMASAGWAPALQWRHEAQDSNWFATFSDTFFTPAP